MRWMKVGFPKKMTFRMMKNDKGFHRSIEKDHIQGLPLNSFKGQIHLIDDRRQFSAVKAMMRECEVFGFDTETKPSFRKGKVNKVALLQLANREQAFIFRINRIGIPDFVKKILEDQEITKVGVAIHDDLKVLNQIRLMHPAGFIDLQQYVGRFNIEDKGLKKLTANILGFRISKRYQTSNWEDVVLSEPQLEYAATDAWVCYEIYNHLNHIS
ncbi:MAG: 3'-5' exonuclease domain-containing protein 2 [Bacteroidales bacterium]|nr:3'-5' exonuclease domain-containing protein 2 [Bacteroidales bacterium]MBN2763785.1 3'-5' exonuclease domain-containing protein 2 [Bacteroidales bacterium]